MPKYYTVCEMTPSWKRNRYDSFSRVYPNAASGYLFHNTDARIEFNHILRPMYVLSELYEKSAKTVIGIRVDEHTIAASFSTYCLPKPAKVSEDIEYLNKSKLKGWVHLNVKDLECETAAIDFDDLYDGCLQLERFTGHCPCPRLSEGTCYPNTVYKRIPELAESMTSFPEADASAFKKKRYTDIDGFKRVPGQYTVSADFVEAVRPWDNYDFNLVPLRAKEFATRGAANSRRSLFRKTSCSKCTFGTVMRDGNVKDCGRINECEIAVQEPDVWLLLYKWLDTSTAFTTGNDDFSVKEINYLMKFADTEYLSRALTPARNIQVKLAGFNTTSGNLRYTVAAAQGDKQRRIYFSSYEALRMVIPELPSSNELPDIEIPKILVLAHAVFSTWSTIRGDGHQPHPPYMITTSNHDVCIHGATTRSVFYAYTLGTRSSAMDFYEKLWGATYEQATLRLTGPSYLYPVSNNY